MRLVETVRSTFANMVREFREELNPELRRQREVAEIQRTKAYFVFDPMNAYSGYLPPGEARILIVPKEQEESYRKQGYMPLDEYKRIYDESKGDQRLMSLKLAGYNMVQTVVGNSNALLQPSMN